MVKTASGSGVFQVAKLIVALLVVSFAASSLLGFLFWRSVSVDYSTKPSSEVFQLVLNENIPDGVSRLKVAGHGVLISHMVWMKYSATDAAITALLKSKKLSFEGPENSLTWVTKEQILSDQDARSVGWDAVLRLKPIESYRYQFVPNGNGWVGEVVIDRENHTVYINSGIL